MADELRVLTSSELKTFRRCAREHLLSYVQLLKPADRAAALFFGTLVHLALEAWWMASADRIAAAFAVIMAADGLDDFEREKVLAMLAGYHARWADEPYEVIGVEMEFRTPIVNPATGHVSKTFMLSGKIDALIRHIPSGRIYILEHKTSSEDFSTGSDYVRRLKVDVQIATYYAAMRDLGYDVAGVIYDILGKTSLKPYKATPEADRKWVEGKPERPCGKCRGKGEIKGSPCLACETIGSLPAEPARLYANQRERDETPAEYGARITDAMAANPDKFFGRVEVVRLAAEEDEARGDLWATARIIRENELAGRAPRNPDACVTWSRLCAYFPICSSETTADDERLYRRAQRPHEELAPTTAPTQGAA